MRAVADASSLIHPARVPRFWALLKETFEQIYIPEAVYKEILKGKEVQSPEVPVVERAISDGWIKVVKVEHLLKLPENLGIGEKEAIALMEQLNADWLLIDDHLASATARLRGITVRSTTYLLIFWTRKRVISQTKAIRLLDDLVESGYYLSSRDYISIKELVTSA